MHKPESEELLSGSPLLGEVGREEIPEGCRHDAGLIHQDCRKAVQIDSKWLD